MPIFLGSQKLKPYRGSTEIKEAYLGSNLVYQSLVVPPYVTGLYICYDAILNTRAGHNGSVTVWEDLSGNKIDATMDGSIVWHDNYLEGTTTNHPRIYIDGEDLTTRDAFTIEFVTRITQGLGNYEGYLHTDKDSSWRQVFGTNTGRYALRYGSSNANYKSVGQDSGLLTNQLMTLSFTYTGSNLYAYINGSRKASTSGAIPAMSGITRTYLYSNPEGGSGYVPRGYIYGFRFYEKALSDAEILANYQVDASRFA